MWWETSFFSLFGLLSAARTRAEVKATATINSNTRYATRRERFVIFTVMLFSPSTATGINKFQPILVPPGIAPFHSLEGLWSEFEELHSAEAPAASRKPERGKRSFIDPKSGVLMCTPCAEPAQNDKLDLNHSIAIT